MHNTARLERPGDNGFAVASDLDLFQPILERRADAEAGSRHEASANGSPDRSAICLTEPIGILHDRIQDGLQIELGPTYDLEDLRRRRLLFERIGQFRSTCFQGLKKPGVFDGNDSLLREYSDKLGLLLGERLDPIAHQRNNAD